MKSILKFIPVLIVIFCSFYLYEIYNKNDLKSKLPALAAHSTLDTREAQKINFSLSPNAGQSQNVSDTLSLQHKKPNIVIIYPDQLRRYSAGYWSQDKFIQDVIGKPDPVITPNIDKLANNGVVLTKAVANYPLCSPSRAMLLSGMYPEQNGVWNNARKDRNEDLNEDIITITNFFSEENYDIGYFGKAHYIKPEPMFNASGDYVGTEKAPGGYFVNDYDTYIPPGIDRHDIDYYYHVLKDDHKNPFVYSNDPQVVGGQKDGEVFQPKEFSTKVESEVIIDFLKNNRQQRKESNPFFIFWSINPPHNPWDDENTDMVEYHKYYDTDHYPKLDSSLVVRKNADPEVADYVRNYFANVTSIDKYIGKVINQLEAMNALNNTLIIFTADHGEMLGSHGLSGKNVLYSESTAVPFIAHWPKGLSPHKTGVLLGSQDIFPTVASLVGVKKNLPKTIEGNDLSANIRNTSRLNDKHGGVLLLLGNSRGLLTEDYTLVLQEDKKPWEKEKQTSLEKSIIFDHEEDPYQLREIPLKERPKLANKLLKKLAVKLKISNDPWFQNKTHSEVIPYHKIEH